MQLVSSFTAFATLCGLCVASPWPYSRYVATPDGNGQWAPDKSSPEYTKQWPPNEFGHWLADIVNKKNVGGLQDLFINASIPDYAKFDDIRENLKLPPLAARNNISLHKPYDIIAGPEYEAQQLFHNLAFDLDPRCTANKTNWWYRTYDGSCNWIKNGEKDEGEYGAAKSRDYGQHAYADGISEPRHGPNPRALSNAFFKRKKEIYFQHTPLLLGLVEFIIHDITWSRDSTTEFIDVPMPDDEEEFPLNTTFRVWRTEAVSGTGTSPQNPRENTNRATTWLDLSALYGSTSEVANALRSFNGGKLLTQEVKTRGASSARSYLPFNTMDVPTNTRPGVSIESLFAGGDPRTNEDWIMLGFHTLMLREHNRLCDILHEKQPEFGDEELYQTVRLLMGAKFQLIANAYQMAYFDNMPWPIDDGFPLFRELLGKSWLDINPANTYPWPLATKHGKPAVVSAEMAVVYRFHEFIIKNFPIKDASNTTLWDQRLFDTAFNASGFLDAGLEGVVRGSLSTTIPNFKSGVEEDFRSAGKYIGHPFDIVVWSIIHEREQGLPTFNDYFREYNKANSKVLVPIREKFEDFSSDPEAVASLKRLYKSPDEVDLVVGCQLDESTFPNTFVPTSALIISLFSLITMGNSDRFSIGFAMMRCLLVDQPWDCHPSNALENLLWKPVEKDGFPNFRFYDQFWVTELDFQAHGENLLWRLITENSEIDCLQRNPLFPVDNETNPVLCTLPKTALNFETIFSTVTEVVLSLVRLHKLEIVGTALAILGGVLLFIRLKK